MQRFTNLFLQLDRTNKTNEKVELLKAYFLSAPDEDRIWALALFTGRRPPRKIKTNQIQEWAIEEAQIPQWLFDECYNSVGDLAETISLVLPRHESTVQNSLSEWFFYLSQLNTANDEKKKDLIKAAWKQLSSYETFVFNKLLMGSFRIGVSQTLVIRAVGELFGIEPSVISHRVMGHWDPYHISFHDLIHSEDIKDELSKPYPFYLAYAVEGDVDDLGDPSDWLAEWKWDGIRSEIIFRQGELYVWSRGEDLVTEKFPELEVMKTLLPANTVLDGELICITNKQETDQNGLDWRPLPFNVLQTRIGRKNISKKTLQEAPVGFIAYDILEFEGNDIRHLPQEQRRKILENIQNTIAPHPVFKLSPLIRFKEWDDLKTLHLKSRDYAAEGFMIKRKQAAYQVGRKKGDWWKWKVDPLSVDAVLIYAQKGSGRRAELYTDYTFAVWDKGKLISFAKAYSGLTDAEIKEVDRFIKQNTLEKFGPVRTVKPELVFEIGFEGINKSTRHKSGIAVRFPRILRWRKDKPANEADTIENLRKILDLYK
jgi:DNA ligase-1